MVFPVQFGARCMITSNTLKLEEKIEICKELADRYWHLAAQSENPAETPETPTQQTGDQTDDPFGLKVGPAQDIFSVGRIEQDTEGYIISLNPDQHALITVLEQMITESTSVAEKLNIPEKELLSILNRAIRSVQKDRSRPEFKIEGLDEIEDLPPLDKPVTRLLLDMLHFAQKKPHHIGAIEADDEGNVLVVNGDHGMFFWALTAVEPYINKLFLNAPEHAELPLAITQALRNAKLSALFGPKDSA